MRCALLAALCLLQGCVSNSVSVGLGSTGSGDRTERQYYLLFGLVSVNEVDTRRMAGSLTSYAVDAEFGWMDLLLAPILLPLTMTSRTVTVRT